MWTSRHKHDFLIGVSTFICSIGLVAINVSPGKAVLSEGQTAADQTAKGMIQAQEELDQLIIEGEVTRVQGEFVGQDFSQMRDQRYRIETPYGEEWNLQLGDHTQKVGQIFLGDRVLAKVSKKDGFLYKVQKISQTNAGNVTPPSGVRRRIVGTIERMDGKFVFLKNGDRTEILHVDDRSHIQGTIREGSKIAANLGDAGYAIGIEEIESASQAVSDSPQFRSESKQ